jgi:NAD/NADP transhydrogenase beta subunit
MSYLVTVLYIVAFGLFILGLLGLTGPKTAVRGKWIAATGMGIAVVATLISVRDTAAINLILIASGLLIGVVLGVPPAITRRGRTWDLPVLALGGSVHAMVLRPRGASQRLA